MVKPPRLEFDGQIWWYVDRYDPAADICCLCRELIPEDEVPLILFKTRGADTLMSRIHADATREGERSCMEKLLALGFKPQPSH